MDSVEITIEPYIKKGYVGMAIIVDCENEDLKYKILNFLKRKLEKEFGSCSYNHPFENCVAKEKSFDEFDNGDKVFEYLHNLKQTYVKILQDLDSLITSLNTIKELSEL